MARNLRIISPREWLNRLSQAYQETDHLLCGAPSNEDSLLGWLAERANAFESRLGLLADLDPSTVAVTRTVLGSLKKFRFSNIDASVRSAAAMDKFEANNAISASNRIPCRFRAGMRRVLRSVFRRYLNGSSIPHFGPGSVAERISVIHRWDSIVTKRGFRDPLSLTSEMLQGTSVPCRLHAVPKDFDKDRLITVEPYLNTYVQHCVRGCILDALGKAPDVTLRLLSRGSHLGAMYDGVSIPDVPTYHQVLSRRGSIDGSLATLDLSDASDLVSFEQVLDVFPVKVLADLEATRTTEYVRGAHRGLMHMYGGMGNATTFLVETLMFYAACHAIAEWFGIPFRDRAISVFGDDIICSSRLAREIIQNKVFDDFGWRINTSKSFWTEDSRFRESCGRQFYDGHDVTLIRYRGFQGNDLATYAAWVDLVKRACQNPRWACIMQTPWDSDIPNSIQYHTSGGLLTSNPFWRDSASGLPLRSNPSTQIREVLVRTITPEHVFIPATGLGPVYGSLAGQLTGHTDHRRRRGHEDLVLRLELDRLASHPIWHECHKGAWWWF